MRIVLPCMLAMLINVAAGPDDDYDYDDYSDDYSDDYGDHNGNAQE